MRDVIGFTHSILKTILEENDVVIDATAGNGHDTLFLAQNVAQVHALDIQEEALKRTRERLDENNLTNVTLHRQGHEHLESLDTPPPKAVIFNLGYLPGGDTSITTKRLTSLEAIKQAIKMVLPAGMVAITLYPGHPEGLEEAMLIESYLTSLSTKSFTVLKYQIINADHSPFSLIVKKH
ncbi:MAG: class I SAM-dependent methyltransferase [Candidatus Izemoplasmataceae bacterium]